MIIIMVMTGDGDDAADGDDDGDDRIMPVAPMMMLTTVRAKMAMIMAGDGDEDDDDDGDADGGDDDGHDDDDDGADDDDAAEDEDDSDCVFFAGEDRITAPQQSTVLRVAVESSVAGPRSSRPTASKRFSRACPGRSLAPALRAARGRRALTTVDPMGAMGAPAACHTPGGAASWRSATSRALAKWNRSAFSSV